MALAGDGSSGGRCQCELLLALLQVQGCGIVQLFEFLQGYGRAGRMHAEVFRFRLLREVGLDVTDLNGIGTEVDCSAGGMVQPGLGGTEVQREAESGEFLVQEH